MRHIRNEKERQRSVNSHTGCFLEGLEGVAGHLAECLAGHLGVDPHKENRCLEAAALGNFGRAQAGQGAR